VVQIFSHLIAPPFSMLAHTLLRSAPTSKAFVDRVNELARSPLRPNDPVLVGEEDFSYNVVDITLSNLHTWLPKHIEIDEFGTQFWNSSFDDQASIVAAHLIEYFSNNGDDNGGIADVVESEYDKKRKHEEAFNKEDIEKDDADVVELPEAAAVDGISDIAAAINKMTAHLQAEERGMGEGLLRNMRAKGDFTGFPMDVGDAERLEEALRDLNVNNELLALDFKGRDALSSGFVWERIKHHLKLQEVIGSIMKKIGQDFQIVNGWVGYAFGDGKFKMHPDKMYKGAYRVVITIGHGNKYMYMRYGKKCVRMK